jgi:hypothetical protein
MKPAAFALALVLMAALATAPAPSQATADPQSFWCGQMDTNADIFISMPYFNGAMTGANLKEYVKEFNGEMTTFCFEHDLRRCRHLSVGSGCHHMRFSAAPVVSLHGSSCWSQLMLTDGDGGSCQTLEEKNIAYKVKWKTPAVQ